MSVKRESTVLMTKFSLNLSFTFHYIYTTGKTDPLELLGTVSCSFPYLIHCQFEFNVLLYSKGDFRPSSSSLLLPRTINELHVATLSNIFTLTYANHDRIPITKGSDVQVDEFIQRLIYYAGMLSMVRYLASLYFSKTFFKMVYLTSSRNNQTTQLSAQQDSVPDQVRARPEDLRAVTATRTTVPATMLAKPPLPWRLGYTVTFQREQFLSVPIPKRPSNWSTYFCSCVRD